MCSSNCIQSQFFFFFQAEDGIRDFHVTGVQTCALPICGKLVDTRRSKRRHRTEVRSKALLDRFDIALDDIRKEDVVGYFGYLERSEERRVGKECRSRWSADHERKRMSE